MDLTLDGVEVWAATMEDRPGALARVLSGLCDAGADLDFVLARRSPDRPGKGVVFVAPLRGDREVAAAADLGFNLTTSVHSLRISGPNRPGAAAAVARKIADAGINVHGFSAAVLGPRFIAYVGFRNAEDAAKAAEVLKMGL